jgi:hypothetical protein
MMVMGMRGMTDGLDRTHMGLWVISSAPLMVGSDLTELSPATLSLLTNEEALAIHNDSYGLQPIKVDEPSPGIQIWVKPMAIAGRRAVAILNRTNASAQIKVNWEKLGLSGAPKSWRDVWNRRDIASVNAAVSVPAHDLALMVVDGEDKTPVEYPAIQTNISGIQATHGPTFAQLRYLNTSGKAAILRMKNTSGLSTALCFPPTGGSETGTIGLILPNGTADLSFEGQPVTIRKLDVYSW